MPPVMLLTSVKPARLTRNTATLRERTPWWHSTSVGALGSSSERTPGPLRAQRVAVRGAQLPSPARSAPDNPPLLDLRERQQLEARQRRGVVLPRLAHVQALQPLAARGRQQLRQLLHAQLRHRRRLGRRAVRCRDDWRIAAAAQPAQRRSASGDGRAQALSGAAAYRGGRASRSGGEARCARRTQRRAAAAEERWAARADAALPTQRASPRALATACAARGHPARCGVPEPCA
jgi:hypothetical protein